MAYTVNKLATLSGVSVRTLHFYDEIGLLKPAFIGNNNYRFYEEEQLLMLQQILFYRELGVSLNEIQRIIRSSAFDKIKALHSHKIILEQGLVRSQVLIQTIDKTIAHLRGETKMKDQELYYGFDSEKQKRYEEELVESGKVSAEKMQEYRNVNKKLTEEDKDKFIDQGKQINEDLIQAINNNLAPDSDAVQSIMRRHHAWVGWKPTKQKYLDLSELYETQEFKKFYDNLHPQLLDFIVKAMRVFADRELT